MSIEKKFLKTKPVCKVKFSLSDDRHASASSVHILGDFNAWKQGISPMKKTKTGEWTAQVDLASGNTYQFRYLIDGTTWENDPQADGFIDNGMGDDNSLLEL